MSRKELRTFAATWLQRSASALTSIRQRAIIAGVIALATVCGAALAGAVLGSFGAALVHLAAFAFVIFLILELLARAEGLGRSQADLGRNLQATLGLYHQLQPRTALPVFGDATLSADTGLEYLALIRQARPQTVVELGSGVSTVIAGYQLEQLGGGRVIAIDHDEQWAELTRQLVAAHGLTDYVEVRVAPLSTAGLPAGSAPWYSVDAFSDIAAIDVLLVDGPPDIYGLGESRRPGLSFLLDRFGADTVALVDDCKVPLWGEWVRGFAAGNGLSVQPLFGNTKEALVLRPGQATPAGE